MAADATFYTVSSELYFPGTVALLNSLRLTGNNGPLVVLDTGMAKAQRDLLAPFCTIVPLPMEEAGHPVLFKGFTHRVGSAGTMVVLDSDIIVTDSLAPIVSRADQGAICLRPDSSPTRWFSEWQQLFDLPGPPRRQTYVNAGFIALSTVHWPRLLERWWQACRRIPASQVKSLEPFADTRVGELIQSRSRADTDPAEATTGGAPDEPLFVGDQDALNAILMSEVPETALELLPVSQVPFLEDLGGVHIEDCFRLLCTHEGERTLMLHYTWRPKPWEPLAWRRLTRADTNAYVRLLSRLLLADDVPVTLRSKELPIWLRRNVAARVTSRSLMAGIRVARAGLDRAPAPVAARIRASLGSASSVESSDSSEESRAP